jgi:hypothetical protein
LTTPFEVALDNLFPKDSSAVAELMAGGDDVAGAFGPGSSMWMLVAEIRVEPIPIRVLEVLAL